jgi:hypothetical protein
VMYLSGCVTCAALKVNVTRCFHRLRCTTFTSMRIWVVTRQGRNIRERSPEFNEHLLGASTRDREYRWEGPTRHQLAGAESVSLSTV